VQVRCKIIEDCCVCSRCSCEHDGKKIEDKMNRKSGDREGKGKLFP